MMGRDEITKLGIGLLKQAADPTRLTILRELAGGRTQVKEMLSIVGTGQPAISHHLQLLTMGGSVRRERRGREIHFALTEQGQELYRIAQILIKENDHVQGGDLAGEMGVPDRKP